MNENLIEGKECIFDRKKYFTYIRPLGSGGTGETYLFKDETTDMFFAFKKYVTIDKNKKEEYYKRFVDEIKILFQLSHPNIVRVYNYYLYPKYKTGYLQMEFINGQSIDKFSPHNYDKKWDDIFIEAILAFEYLELNNILHRDIRDSNIMIDNLGNLKIIDFGFGKLVNRVKEDKNSILLNWPVSEYPNEITENGEYNHSTEIYFLGKLFKKILEKSKNNGFSFNNILNKMTKVDPQNRYLSFNDVTRDIYADKLNDINFSEEDKWTYRKFADDLVESIAYYTDKYNPIDNIEEVLNNLEEVVKTSSLESHLQNNSILIRCFIENSYRYKIKIFIEYETISNFFRLFNKLTISKKNIVLSNIHNRLRNIPVVCEQEEDIPF